jgi:hypothetical protein
MAMAMTRTGVVRDLLELIAALDRRIPHVERAGETAIARDAATLKARALKRIEEIERERGEQNESVVSSRDRRVGA